MADDGNREPGKTLLEIENGSPVVKYLLAASFLALAAITSAHAAPTMAVEERVAVQTPLGELRCTPKIEVSYRCELVQLEVAQPDARLAIIDDGYGCGCIRPCWWRDRFPV